MAASSSVRGSAQPVDDPRRRAIADGSAGDGGGASDGRRSLGAAAAAARRASRATMRASRCRRAAARACPHPRLSQGARDTGEQSDAEFFFGEETTSQTMPLRPYTVTGQTEAPTPTRAAAGTWAGQRAPWPPPAPPRRPRRAPAPEPALWTRRSRRTGRGRRRRRPWRRRAPPPGRAEGPCTRPAAAPPPTCPLPLPARPDDRTRRLGADRDYLARLHFVGPWGCPRISKAGRAGPGVLFRRRAKRPSRSPAIA